MKRILVDANVLMEVLFAQPKLAQCQAALQGAGREFYISTLTAHILYYFGEQTGVPREFVAEVVAICGHLPLEPQAVKRAQEHYTGKDFEDCLQAACAERHGCDEIVTLNKNFARDSGTILPVQFIA
jgi:predicted nucleic acid-binding protein